MEHEKRSSRRYKVNWQAWCCDSTGLTTRVSIVDCSDGNFGISGSCPPAADGAVKLSIDNIGEFSCQVVWARGNRFAVRIVDDQLEQSIAQLSTDLVTTLA